MTASIIVCLAAFFLTGGAVLLAFRVAHRSGRLPGRLRELSGRPTVPRDRDVLSRFAGKSLPNLIAPLLVVSADQRTRLQTKLLHAGLYQRQVAQAYMSVKLVLLLTPWLVGLALGLLEVVPMKHGITGGGICSILGLVGPGMWLERSIARRRSLLRAGLPDVLDILVLCLEAGQSLTAAFQLVTSEFRASHPQLGFELRIALREMQMGCPLSQSLRNLADRTGLEETSVLASIVEQSERLGASLVRSLRAQAEQLRFRRTQRAEERAQKASAKMIFPTLLCIFPAIFVILLGPAALQVQEAMEKRKALQSPSVPRTPPPIPLSPSPR